MAVTFDGIFIVCYQDSVHIKLQNFQNCLICNECVTFDPFRMSAVRSERLCIVTFKFICPPVWWQGAMFSCH